MGGPLGVFRHWSFLIFWIGACISNTGKWTENVGQSWAVTSQTIGNHHQGLLVEILQFADFCPVLPLALLAGVISDGVNPGTRRLTTIGVIFMFLAAPLQGLLPVFAQSVLKGDPGLFGLMLSAISLGSILGSFLLSSIPSYYYQVFRRPNPRAQAPPGGPPRYLPADS